MWQTVLMTFVAGAVMSPAAPASATPGWLRVPTPAPQPFSPYECYQHCSSPALVRTATPGLSVNLPGPEFAQVLTEFEVRSAPGMNGRLVTAGLTTNIAPTTVTWRVPEGALVGGQTYYWRSRAFSERYLPSEWTQWQQLGVDTERPHMPTVGSEEYPEKQWGGVLGTPGTFHFSSASPDVVEFRWWLSGGPTTVTPATGTRPVIAAVTFTPPTDMTNVLFVEAVDPSGQVSETRKYEFWVTPLPVRYSHWTLDEQGGTTAADSGTVLADGTLSGEVAFGPGYVGGFNGAWFSGAGGQIATTDAVLDTAQSFTVMAWVNLSDPGLGDQTVLSQSGSQANGFQLQFKQDANGGAGAWCFTVRGADSPDATQAACADGAIAGPPTPGQWVHIAGRYDAGLGQVAIYVMGGENCLGESARSTFTSTWPAIGPFLIGRSIEGQWWRGGVDDVYAHQRALSEASICQQALQ